MPSLGNCDKTSGTHLKRNTGPALHDDVIKWKHSPRYWSFVQGIHR